MPNSGAAAPRARGTSTACAGATHRSAPSCPVSRVSGPPQTENSVGPARLSTATTLPPDPRSSAERPAAVARVRPVNPTRALGLSHPGDEMVDELRHPGRGAAVATLTLTV